MTDFKYRTSLQTILALDATTCAVMGMLLVFASRPIAGLTEIPGPLIYWAGLLLLPIAIFMVVFARAAVVPVWAVQIIVTGNVLWVLGSVLLPVAGLIAPNGLGWAFLVLQAAVVALFAGLEWTSRHRTAVVA